MSDGRQQRHTPDAALRIHVRVGKLVLKTQTEERASALNSCGSEEVSSVPLTSGAECTSVLKLVLWLSTHLEVAGGGRKWRKSERACDLIGNACDMAYIEAVLLESGSPAHNFCILTCSHPY